MPRSLWSATTRSPALGGLWEGWRAPNGEMLRGFCLIITAANGTVAPLVSIVTTCKVVSGHLSGHEM